MHRMRVSLGPTKSVRALALALPALASAGCVSLPPLPAGLAAAAPTFSPESFFQGRTEGQGTIAVITRRPHAVHVLGSGRLEADGTLVLSQIVEEAGGLARRRQWSMRQVSLGRYVGTLSDAAGPVTGEVDGNMLHLQFRMTGGLAAEQRLYLRPDGRTAINRMTVRKLGVVVAVLNETIRKVE